MARQRERRSQPSRPDVDVLIMMIVSEMFEETSKKGAPAEPSGSPSEAPEDAGAPGAPPRGR